MFLSHDAEYGGLDVLLVEDDPSAAKILATSITAGGGKVFGISATVAEAVEIVRTVPVQLVMLHTHHVADHPVPLSAVFGEFGAGVIFRVGYDDWYEVD